MSVTDINGHVIDGGGRMEGQPYFQGRSSFQVSTRLGSAMVLLAPHESPQASPLDSAKGTTLFVKLMMERVVECFQSALDWCEYQEKEVQLNAELSNHY